MVLYEVRRNVDHHGDHRTGLFVHESSAQEMAERDREWIAKYHGPHYSRGADWRRVPSIPGAKVWRNGYDDEVGIYPVQATEANAGSETNRRSASNS